MEDATRRGDWQKVSELQYGKLPQLEAQLKAAEAGENPQSSKTKLLRTQVGAEEIAEVDSLYLVGAGWNPAAVPVSIRDDI